MYVQRLIEFAEENVKKITPTGYKEKKIQWIADVDESGLTLLPLKNISLLVPDVGRSSNIKPILLADKPDYVFGFYEKEKDRSKSESRRLSFLELLEKYIMETNDKDVKLLYNHLKNQKHIDEKFRMGDFIVFRNSSGSFLHEKESVMEFWKHHINQKTDKKEKLFMCMFCHKKKPVLRRHTIDFVVGRDRTKLISANSNAYESHGLKNSEIAPTCYDCEQKYGKALEYLLAKYKDNQLKGGPHMFNVGGMTYIYWIRGGEQLEHSFSHFVSPQDKQTTSDMRDLLNQAFKGVTKNRDTNNFCLLSLSSNKGRLVVRDYIEDSAGSIKNRIEEFFVAQDVGQKRLYGIYTLASTMYTEPRNQMQKYAIEQWMGWFLHGHPLSSKVLIPILRQIQAKGVMYPQFGAAIKSWLVSQSGKGRDWKMSINNETDAYITGEVFAILERIQYASTNSESTITGKYFSAASTTPRSIMGMIIRNTQYHLNKLSNSNKTRGIAVNLEKELGKSLSKLATFPTTLSLEQQAEFALGYYHKRQQFFAKKNEEKEVDKHDS